MALYLSLVCVFSLSQLIESALLSRSCCGAVFESGMCFFFVAAHRVGCVLGFADVGC